MIQQTNITIDSSEYIGVLKTEVINLKIENIELKAIIEHLKSKLENIEMEKLKESEND